ncbi:MAG TPA: tetratricopeptide repeat protein, partial [Gemmatimonadaceae bacterium]
ALKSYAAGLVANDIQGNYPAAIQDFHDAIAQDSTFAMAYVQLAYSLLTLGGPGAQAKATAALTTAFRLRDRLPERERYNVEGAYFTNAAPDRKRAIAAFRHAVDLDSTNYDAANSLAVDLDDTRQYPEAERMYRLALSSVPTNGTLLANLAMHYTSTGEHKAFDSVMAVLASSGVPYPSGPARFLEYWNRRDYDSAEHISRMVADTSLDAQDGLVDIELLRGRLREAARQSAQVNAGRARLRGDTINPYIVAFREAEVDGEIRGDAQRGLAVLDAALRATPLTPDQPVSRDQSYWLAVGYAALGAPAKARELMNRYVARLDTLTLRRKAVDLARLQGDIALAEGKTDSAVADFKRGDNDADGLPTRNCTPCTPLLLGLAFDRGGQSDSARAYLTQYVEMHAVGRWNIDRVYLGPVLFRLGELYEKANDAAHATEYYGRFADLWANADPELQPRVAEARTRIAQLDRAKR